MNEYITIDLAKPFINSPIYLIMECKYMYTAVWVKYICPDRGEGKLITGNLSNGSFLRYMHNTQSLDHII